MKKNQNADVQRKMKNKEEILTETVAKLFNTIDSNDVLFRHNGERWILGNKELTEGQLRQYAEEAEVILRFGIWKELMKCVKYINNRKMFLESRTIEDLTAGKLLLYLLQTFEDILTTAANLKSK